MPAPRRRRTYDSPLRGEQMDRTRAKLIDAGVDLVAEAGGEELTVRRVAARARVSVPTAYRHFGDRDALIEAMAASINARIGGPIVPTTVDEAPDWVRYIYSSFESNDRLVRAQLSTPAGRALRAKNQKARHVQMLEMTKRSFSTATPASQRRFTALLQLLVNVPSWISLHDNWEMSGVEAGEVTAWALETLLARLHQDPTALDLELPLDAPPEQSSATSALVPQAPRRKHRPEGDRSRAAKKAR